MVLLTILVIVNILFTIILLKKIVDIKQKIKAKLIKIDALIEHSQTFILPAYNNTIRIAKKLGVYYCLNKEDYEHNKQLKTERKD